MEWRRVLGNPEGSHGPAGWTIQWKRRVRGLLGVEKTEGGRHLLAERKDFDYKNGKEDGPNPRFCRTSEQPLVWGGESYLDSGPAENTQVMGNKESQTFVGNPTETRRGMESILPSKLDHDQHFLHWQARLESIFAACAQSGNGAVGCFATVIRYFSLVAR